jgi:hypothetical protein
MGIKNANDELVNFLLLPENFDTALEISQGFPLVVNQLQTKFWLLLKERVEDLLKLSPKEFANWDCELEKGNPTDTNFFLRLVPEIVIPTKLYCSPCIQQEGALSKFPLFYGIAWSDRPRKEPILTEFNELKRQVRENLKLINTGGGWWVGGRYLDHRLHDPDSLKQLFRDDSLQRLIADQLVRLFKDTRELMESLNKSLSK